MRPQRCLRRWIEPCLQALGDVTCLMFLGGCTSAALALLDLGADPDAGHGSGPIDGQEPVGPRSSQLAGTCRAGGALKHLILVGTRGCRKDSIEIRTG